MKVQPILAPALLYLRYTGTHSVHTVTFDADGGTGTEGRLTLIDDTGTTTFDANTYSTLTTLVAAINVLGGRGWAATPFYGLAEATVTGKTALAQRVLSDMAATTVTKVPMMVMIPTNDYEVVANATATLKTALAIATGFAADASVQLVIDGTGAGTGNVTYNVIANPYGGAYNVAPNWDIASFADYWDTLTLSSSLVIAGNGTTEARKTVQLDCTGIPQIRFVSVIQANANDFNVSGTVNFA